MPLGSLDERKLLALLTNGDKNLVITDNTANDVSTSAHGFAPKAPNDTTKYLRGDGTWSSANIWSKTITGSAVTSVTTNGEVTLDGNAHCGYRFEFIIVNPAGAASDYRLYVNNDTTDANYYFFRNYYGAGAGTPAPSNDALIVAAMAASTTAFICGEIMLSADGYVTISGHAIQSNNYGIMFSWRKTATIANLTRIDIVGPTGKIDVNSSFQLWRKK